LSFPSGTTSDAVNKTREELEQFSMNFGAKWADKDPDHENAIVDYLSWGNSTKLLVYLILLDNEVREFTINEFSLALARELPENPVLESVLIGNDSMFGGDPIFIRFLEKDDDQL
jgi:hypothetical protein